MRPVVIVRSHQPERPALRMLRITLVRALQIIAMAALLTGAYQVLGWMAETDAQVERASIEAYCTGVATWQAEAGRGIAPERRTGHPDYNGVAADQCPGLRPAGTVNNQRQLARN